ncbi:MAG: glycoside hydrolase family 1 protein [Patescibacteria group bacterium]|nr:glycoside hydrolase family 1 protein [Patescibacteria group bacterium]
MGELKFPQNFLWGAATASHQVEGDTHNQWSEWEKSPARLAQLTKDGLITKYGKENFISGRAADHYNRYEEDFKLAKELGHNATRISLEWSRIEPREGEFDTEAIEHYRRVIASIRNNGMEPFVTLWHWTFPLWFRDRGGFERKRNAKYFTRYVKKVATELRDVKFWLTLNEPELVTGHSYLFGLWPPQAKSALLTFKVLHNLIYTHREAYRAMKSVNPALQIGIAKHNVYYEAYGGKPHNVLIKKALNLATNFYFLNRIRGYQDFIGLNHYFHNRIKDWRLSQNENKKTSDMGWELYPEAIYYALIDLRRYNLPVYITENGLADAKDSNREWFITETLKNVSRAIANGIDVRGYLHWSLMDNFEWAYGFWPRFGLLEINYKTLKRKIRSSALAYKKIIQNS